MMRSQYSKAFEVMVTGDPAAAAKYGVVAEVMDEVSLKTLQKVVERIDRKEGQYVLTSLSS